ncbi:MAG: type VI secretion system contractile sheath large subunit [Planctomycetaceae bacterium]
MALTKSSVSFGMPLSESASANVVPDSPFRILLLGDFGAAKSWNKPVSVDRDNLDEVFARLDVRCTTSLDAGAPPVDIAFSELEDFHPDRLYSRLKLFSALRSRRERLSDSATFEDEAALIRASDSRSDSQPPAPESPVNESPANADVTADLLAGAIAQTQAASKPLMQQIVEGNVDWDAYVRQLVEPYVVARADPRQAEFIAGVDEAIAETMRRLLHSPSFQQLEAAWRGVEFLIRRLETDRSLQVFLVNVSKQSLSDDLFSTEDPAATRLYKLVAESATVPGAEPWTLVLGNFEFGLSDDDCRRLGRLASIHKAAGSAFVAGALPEIIGCAGFDAAPDPDDWVQPPSEKTEAWDLVRASSAAKYVGLSLPRILARQPYGRDSNPIESFAFEEIPDGTQHGAFLWMNSAFGRVCQLGQAFSEAGWDVTAAFNDEIDHLPVFLFDDDGEETVKPCAEASLSLRAAKKIAACGLSVVLSVRDEGKVLMPGLRSLALDETQHLTGRWLPPR